MDRAKMRKFLDKHSAMLPRPRLGRSRRWPVEVIESIRALQGRSYEEPDQQVDWLDRFTQEGPHGSHRTKPAGDR
jgi:hypothetical protein